MRIKDALFGVFIGNAIAGAVMLVVSLHLSEGSIEVIMSSILLALAGVVIYRYKKIKNKKVAQL